MPVQRWFPQANPLVPCLLTLGLLCASSSASLAQVPLEQRPRPAPPELGERSETLRLSNRRTPEVLAAQSARPGVVYIETDLVVSVGRDIFGRNMLRQSKSTGSGAVIFDEGFVVTNYHVIKGATAITVFFDRELDPQPYPARLVSQVESEDLALLKIEREEPFPTIPMGSSADLMIAEPVLAIGNPFGQTLTVSRGIISGLHRFVEVDNLQFQGLIQTDASINPGNSGGPLININGELIGINTVMNAQAENIGFAIPVDRVRQVLEESLLSPNQAQAWFGLELGQGPAALEVVRVMPSSPADRAGVKTGDRVVALAGRPIAGLEEYNRQRVAIAPGESVQVEFLRGNERIKVTIDSWDRIDGYLFERAGLRLQAIQASDERNVYRLLRIHAVRPESPAARLGLRPGDFLEAILVPGRMAFWPATPQDLAIYISQLAPKSSLLADVWRDSNENGRLEGDERRSELLRGTLTLD
jgi:serine protease Do